MKFKAIATVLLVICIVACSDNVSAQKQKVNNLPNYEQERLHFGFTIGVNRANYSIKNVKGLATWDTILYVYSIPQYGFNLAIVSDLRLHQFVTLRFLPALSFQERIMEYSIVQNPDTLLYQKNVESTVLDFPLLLKLRSARYNNVACYLVGGLKYSYDLASQKDVKTATSLQDQIVKVKKGDMSYEAGAGLDVYFPYFKFSVEVKGSWGLKDLLVKDNAVFSKTIDKLTSQLVIFSFHFEG